MFSILTFVMLMGMSALFQSHFLCGRSFVILYSVTSVNRIIRLLNAVPFLHGDNFLNLI